MAETTTMQEKVFVNPDHSSQVLYQLSELWRDKKLCDATIEVGPVKVYVHRLVLLAACPYLLTIGGQHDVPVLEVKLPMSVGLEGLNVFLTYLYDGVLNLTTSNLLSVEKISKILKVTGIKKFCQEFRHMDQTVREAVGPSEQVVSDYSIKMTDNTIKIIFSEYAGNLGELKRESNEPETEPTESKRKKISIDSLSSALQQQCSNNASSSRVQKSTEGSRGRIKVKISRNVEGFTSNTTSSKPDSGEDSETTSVHIKQEPISYSDYEDDNTESYDESSRDQTQTDFVRQAPYNTQAFPDEKSGFSVTENLHPQRTDTESEPVGNADASQVLQNVVKSMPEMALGLDTAAEIGEDNEPQDKETYAAISDDFSKFINWLKIRYPGDYDLNKTIEALVGKYELRKRSTYKKLTNAQVMEMLKDSYSAAARGITGEFDLDISSLEACIVTFKQLQKLQSDKRNTLLVSAQQGMVLEQMKMQAEERGPFMQCLRNEKIILSLSYSNFLIAFYNITLKYPEIFQCSLPLNFFARNFKALKVVAPMLFNR